MESVGKKISDYSSLVMFEHTIFALPFAYFALFLASGGWPSLNNFFWITVAMIGARNGANAWNRVADYKIDKLNPRTKDREIPVGKVSKKETFLLTVFCFILLLLAALNLDPIAVKLMPLAVLFVLFYSYTKRFTWACHLVLGAAVALAPLGSWIAVTGSLTLGSVMLASIHALWVAGFDIIYATQDYDFDRENSIRSIPAKFGIKKALKIAGGLHFLTVIIMFSLVYFFPDLGFVYLIAVILVTFLLIYEHRLVSPDDLSQVKIASYSINQIISPLLFLGGAIDILL
ncbi:4-hydroxybenzoate octaprenyltransferase [Halanaerobium kushneri]|uniref:4-hydroxybenzoate polyprenyltransferase n=1 Tax=Halanaerobium kushneri TaxID=56779 RepID=A0A1N6WSR5_9FIRM|nr:4-hydroxybenzoate octaprenyltransferase [Halanaerobium kushneri]SIQ93097.1 4-hydroxybenzoate polyprenyltransferase [Halanaerobium kushneri]